MSILKPGRYDFSISGVIRNDKAGNPLKTKNGGSYVKLKLCVIDEGNRSHNVYDLVFNKERLEQIVESIGKSELKKKAKSKDFKIETLIGESGRCLTKIRPGRDGYDDMPAVEVYLKPDVITTVKEAVQEQAATATQEPEYDHYDDDIPF